MTYTLLYVWEGGKADNSAKSKVGCPEASGWYAQALRYPDSYLDHLGFGVIGKDYWSFLAAKSDKGSFRKQEIELDLKN